MFNLQGTQHDAVPVLFSIYSTGGHVSSGIMAIQLPYAIYDTSLVFRYAYYIFTRKIIRNFLYINGYIRVYANRFLVFLFGFR